MKNNLVYFIKKDDKFLRVNSDLSREYVSKLQHASPIFNEKHVVGREHISISVDEFKALFGKSAGFLIVSGEIFNRFSKQYNSEFIAIPKMNKHVRTSVKNAIDKTAFFHDIFNEIETTQEDDIHNTSGQLHECIDLFNEFFFKDSLAILEVLKAYAKSPESVLGISKKVLR
jgi:hypothetical protein